MNNTNRRKEFTFNGQRPGEKVTEVVRNHPVVLVWPVVKMVVPVAATVLIYLKFNNEFVGLVALVLIPVGLAGFLRAFYMFKESVCVITNGRIINVEQGGFVKRKITETEIDRIQDIASQTDGLLRMMFKFGDVIIRTAGSSDGKEIRIKNIAKPYEIQQKIVNTK